MGHAYTKNYLFACHSSLTGCPICLFAKSGDASTQSHQDQAGVSTEVGKRRRKIHSCRSRIHTIKVLTENLTSRVFLLPLQTFISISENWLNYLGVIKHATICLSPLYLDDTHSKIVLLHQKCFSSAFLSDCNSDEFFFFFSFLNRRRPTTRG